MSADYYYETFENGYYIKDRNNPYIKTKQVEPFIFHRDSEDDKDYRAIAQRHIEYLKERDAEAEKERVTFEQLQTAIEEQNTMIIDNTYRVTMLELMQSGISL